MELGCEFLTWQEESSRAGQYGWFSHTIPAVLCRGAVPGLPGGTGMENTSTACTHGGSRFLPHPGGRTPHPPQ